MARANFRNLVLDSFSEKIFPAKNVKKHEVNFIKLKGLYEDTSGDEGDRRQARGGAGADPFFLGVDIRRPDMILDLERTVLAIQGLQSALP